MCGAFWGRFGIGDVARELAMCAPFGIPGALAGLVLGALLARARGPWSRKIARLGYVIAVPPAWYLALRGLDGLRRATAGAGLVPGLSGRPPSRSHRLPILSPPRHA